MNHAYNGRVGKEVKALRARGFVVERRNEGGAVLLDLRKDGVGSTVQLGVDWPFMAPVVAPVVRRDDWSVVTKLAWWVDVSATDEERVWCPGGIPGRTVPYHPNPKPPVNSSV